MIQYPSLNIRLPGWG